MEKQQKLVIREQSMPSAARVKDMQDDLDFKARELETSGTTQQRLDLELSRREQELLKIETLDTKGRRRRTDMTFFVKNM